MASTIMYVCSFSSAILTVNLYELGKGMSSSWGRGSGRVKYQRVVTNLDFHLTRKQFLFTLDVI